jgi:hypothetical protein
MSERGRKQEREKERKGNKQIKSEKVINRKRE